MYRGYTASAPPDTCSGGSCSAGPPLNCDDFDSCTAESCDEILGCAHEPIPGCGEEIPAGSNRTRLGLLLLLLTIGTIALRERKSAATP